MNLKYRQLFNDNFSEAKYNNLIDDITSDFDYNAVPAKLTVVPSLLEAHDIIEMEEIERDLGF